MAVKRTTTKPKVEVEENVEEVVEVEEVRDPRQAVKTYSQTVKAKLDKQEKVNIFIPLDPEKPGDNIAMVNIGGCKEQIPRGEDYEVPKEVARVWNESYSKTIKATQNINFKKLD